MDAAKREAFMAALAKVSAEHGVEVAGCGCHGSPFLLERIAPVARYVVDEDDQNLSAEPAEPGIVFLPDFGPSDPNEPRDQDGSL